MTNLATFIQTRRPLWRKLEETLQRVEGSGLGALNDEQAVEFGQLYRWAASDLNQAQTFVSGDSTVQYLNDLVARCYLAIYGRERINPFQFLRAWFFGYPAVFRRYLGYTFLATVLFLVGAVFGYGASLYDPAVGRSFLLPSGMSMIQPDQEGHPMSAGEVTGMTGFYFANNTSVSLVAFALGLTFGIGTAWMMWTNGILLGALLAVFQEAGQFRTFCAEVLPHGVVEIPSILIAGGAGFLLAQGMIRARPWSRIQEMARVGKEALFLASGCFPLLAAAAILEAAIARAPRLALGSGLKLAVAGVVGLTFAAYVLLIGWKWAPRKSAENPSLSLPES